MAKLKDSLARQRVRISFAQRRKASRRKSATTGPSVMSPGVTRVYRVPCHLPDMSQRHLHAFVSHWFRVAHTKDEHGFEQRAHLPEVVEATMRTLRQVDHFFTPEKPLDEAVKFLTPHLRQSRQTRTRGCGFHPQETERR
jgi:hypothetical protein